MKSQAKSYNTTVHEASEIAGVQIRTIYNWIKQETVSYERSKRGKSNQIRLNEEEIRAFAKKRARSLSEADQVIAIPREEYNQLIFRLGVLETERQRRLEIEEKAESLMRENERLRMKLSIGWWDRFKGWWWRK